MSNEVEETAADWIRRLVGAWDCCGTCAGGVLAERDARVRAEAWDEGALWAAVECGAIGCEAEPWLAPGDNPHREGRT